jgi:hypothetical protein
VLVKRRFSRGSVLAVGTALRVVALFQPKGFVPPFDGRTECEELGTAGS